MDTTKTPETMAAAFDHWRQMNAVLPTLTDTLNDRMCDRICAIEADMLALPVATIKDLWSLRFSIRPKRATARSRRCLRAVPDWRLGWPDHRAAALKIGPPSPRLRSLRPVRGESHPLRYLTGRKVKHLPIRPLRIVAPRSKQAVRAG